MIQDAIENRKLLKFKYFAPSGESERTIEPYYIVFKWTSWYVYGWCLKRKDYRLFKLNRMDKVRLSDKNFECRSVPLPDMSAELLYPRNIKVKALFDPDMKWRLVEEFGTKCYSENEDGKLHFTADYSDMDNLVSWLLTFGDKAEVLEPGEVRERLKTMAENMIKTYGRTKK
jgi:predicted DNA-binding transcriptional regulator YafY